MAFYGAEIIYDGVPSSLFDLTIMDFSTSGDVDSPAGSDMEIYEKYVLRRSKAYYFGRSLNTPLEFDITLGSKNPIEATTRNAIQKLFLGRNEYLNFQIVQDDMMTTKFEVLFTSAENKYIGNINRAITLHGRCNSPYGFTFPNTLSYTFSGNTNVDYNFSFYNDSASSDYMKPITVFTLNSVGNFFTLTNITDNNRAFSFTGLQPHETITVDNDKQIVTSDTGLLRLSLFNKNWFRLLPGNNELNIKSGIGTFSLTYYFTRSIGA